ncbi:MAG: caspase family protein [Thermoanaerobaculia bacterium]
MLWRICVRCVYVWLFLHGALSYAQNCVTQALGSLDKARAELAVGDVEKGRAWIEQATLECSTSAVVLRKVADLYELIGEADTARSYRQRAEAQDRGPQLTLQPPAGRTAGNENADCVGVLSGQKGWVREKYAIAIGVSEFVNAKIRDLRYAAKDASNFASALTNPSVGRFKSDPEHVKLLVNEAATVPAVRTAINDVARAARPEDLVVLYISSHGTSAESDIASDDAKSGYIVTHETDPQNLYGTAFPMEELRRVVEKRIRACRIVLFLDTCYSGDTVAPAAGQSKALELGGVSDAAKQKIAQGVGRVVIASSRNDELSWESERDQNSFFTHFLLEALRSRGGTSDITSIFTYLQRNVPTAVRREMGGARQTPVMWPEGQRIDIVIGTAVDE